MTNVLKYCCVYRVYSQSETTLARKFSKNMPSLFLKTCAILKRDKAVNVFSILLALLLLIRAAKSAK